jgi:hypothetical protein
MYIQYVGFNLEADSRMYRFHVIDTSEAREFTVQVQAEAFRRPACLKLQDGPGICFTHLERELQRETHESRTEPNLSIAERDIQEYLARHYPRKQPTKNRHPFVDR